MTDELRPVLFRRDAFPEGQEGERMFNELNNMANTLNALVNTMMDKTTTIESSLTQFFQGTFILDSPYFGILDTSKVG